MRTANADVARGPWTVPRPEQRPWSQCARTCVRSGDKWSLRGHSTGPPQTSGMVKLAEQPLLWAGAASSAKACPRGGRSAGAMAVELVLQAAPLHQRSVLLSGPFAWAPRPFADGLRPFADRPHLSAPCAPLCHSRPAPSHTRPAPVSSWSTAGLRPGPAILFGSRMLAAGHLGLFQRR